MGLVLVVAAMAAFDPVRLAITVILISRPQPLRSLFAYWLGAVAMSMAAALGLLTILRDLAPLYVRNVTSFAASPTGRHLQIAAGLLALLFASLIAVGFSANQRAPVPTPAVDPSAQVLRASTPSMISRLLTGARGMMDGERLWVAFVAGLGSGPPPVEYAVVIAAIAASNAALHTQIGLAIVFVIVMLTVVEIPLVSCLLATPVKTQALMLRLQNWVRCRRRGIVAVLLAAAGVLLVTAGMGSA
jgi:hypothetical protein